jgi:hypothetical protein
MSEDMTEETFGHRGFQLPKGDFDDRHGCRSMNPDPFDAPTDHPEAETIVRYALNQLQDRVRMNVFKHLQIPCPYCQAEVDALIEAMGMPLDLDEDALSRELGPIEAKALIKAVIRPLERDDHPGPHGSVRP